MSGLPAAIQLLVVLTVFAAAVTDLRDRRVPNWITLASALMAVALNASFSGTAGISRSLAGLGLALAIYLPLYLLRAMGAGDVKLMLAIGAAVGPANWLIIFCLTAIFGGLAAIIVILARGRWRQTFHNVFLILSSARRLRAPYTVSPKLNVKSSEAMRLPHAVAIALGTVGFLTPAMLSALAARL